MKVDFGLESSMDMDNMSWKDSMSIWVDGMMGRRRDSEGKLRLINGVVGKSILVDGRMITDMVMVGLMVETGCVITWAQGYRELFSDFDGGVWSFGVGEFLQSNTILSSF